MRKAAHIEILRIRRLHEPKSAVKGGVSKAKVSAKRASPTAASVSTSANKASAALSKTKKTGRAAPAADLLA